MSESKRMLLFELYRMQRARQKMELEQHSIELCALHVLFEAKEGVLVFGSRWTCWLTQRLFRAQRTY
ncbi:MAG: hypothetical protein M3Y50_00620 [Acidobacteriota bacterium]|nr:hypothetical protein [Acidobacteriota bacterium]